MSNFSRQIVIRTVFDGLGPITEWNTYKRRAKGKVGGVGPNNIGLASKGLGVYQRRKKANLDSTERRETQGITNSDK